MDRLTEAQRSANMARIGHKDTTPELTVRRVLHALGYRFRLHRRDLPGTPDITLSRYRTVILVHGCFWHRHPGCRFAYMPKSRVEFWKQKFQKNVRHDRKVRLILEKNDWKVLTIWECETRDLKMLKLQLHNFLKSEQQ